jgi:hypothetical protein
MLKNPTTNPEISHPIAEGSTLIARSARMAVLMALLTACSGEDSPETLIFETRYQEVPCEEDYEYCIKNLDTPTGDECEDITITLTDAEDKEAMPITAASKIYPDGKCKAIFTPNMKGFGQGPFEVKIQTPKGHVSTDCDGGSAVQAIEVWAGNGETQRGKNSEIEGREILNCIMPE